MFLSTCAKIHLFNSSVHIITGKHVKWYKNIIFFAVKIQYTLEYVKFITGY